MTNSKIAIIGGTGNLGAAIGFRLVNAGHAVIIGSRLAQNAQTVAASLGARVVGMSNAQAAAAGDIIIVTVPFAAQEATFREIAPYVAGKIVVDTTVPLQPPKVMRVQLPPEGSAAMRARQFLGDDVRMLAAFHNVAAHKLSTNAKIECDVLVFGDDKDTRSELLRLIADMGLRGIHGGALANAAAAEALTSILIFINKAYAVDGAGIRITGNLIEHRV